MLMVEGFEVGQTTVKAAVAEVEAQAPRGLRSARVPPGRPGGGGLLRGARRADGHDGQSVDVRDAPDAFGPRLRVALPAVRTSPAFGRRPRARLRALRVRAPAASRTTTSRPPSRRSSSAPSASSRAGSKHFSIATHLFEPWLLSKPRTGHDKGGVESRGKAIRLQHLVPIPRGDDLGTMRPRPARTPRRRVRRHPVRRGAGAVNTTACTPLRPASDAPRRRSRRKGLVCVEGGVYSVPCEWARLDVTRPCRGRRRGHQWGPRARCVARTPARSAQGRSTTGTTSGRLARKPQAVRQVAAELTRDLGPPFAAAWRSLVDAHGPKQAARVFAKVLAHVERRGCRGGRRDGSQAPRSERSEPLLTRSCSRRGAAHLGRRQPAARLTCATCPSKAGRASGYDALLQGGRS